MNESGRRINEILRDYWQRIRMGRIYPAESDIDPDAIGNIWGSCFIVKITPKAVKERLYEYAYLGISLLEALSNDSAHQSIFTHLINPGGPYLTKHIEKVMTHSAPVEEHAQFEDRQGKTIKYRSCFLPVGTKVRGISSVMGGVKWKIF